MHQQQIKENKKKPHHSLIENLNQDILFAELARRVSKVSKFNYLLTDLKFLTPGRSQHRNLGNFGTEHFKI